MYYLSNSQAQKNQIGNFYSDLNGHASTTTSCNGQQLQGPIIIKISFTFLFYVYFPRYNKFYTFRLITLCEK
jgi:hypothetical protein